MKKIKWENIVFIGLSIFYIINTLKIENNVIATLLVQELIVFMACMVIKYIRTHTDDIIKDLKNIFYE